MKLLYVPVERYESRWTHYASGMNGMFMRVVKSKGDKIQTELIAPHDDVMTIKSGVVLDTKIRADWSFKQVLQLIDLIQTGKITSDDVIYVEDFWWPGMEMIPYACQLAGIRPKVYALLHAQSVDPADFTFAMLPWIRHFEKGWAEWLTGIFVSDPILKNMVVAGGLAPKEKVHDTGMIMVRDVLIEHFYAGLPKEFTGKPREKVVLFTSRTDPEKRPDLFFGLAKLYYHLFGKDSVTFRMLSGREFPQHIQEQATEAGVEFQTVSKRQYFQQLCTSAVMVNTAVQDFVSYALLDCLAYGCLPLVPDWLTFPGVLQHDKDYLYLNQNIDDAAARLQKLLEHPQPVFVEGSDVPKLYDRFATKYEGSAHRMLTVMSGGSL